MLRVNSKDNKVNVLMSVYNGRNYLSEQLSSLAKQDYKNFVVHIRDDCSGDNTPLLVQEQCRKLNNWHFRQGDHLGVFGSFMDLLRHADDTSTYFAFCDQDDIWMSDKLSRAVSFIEENSDSSGPVLYCARVNLVDASLNPLGATRVPRLIGFENAVVENVATGCTIVMNRKARELLLQKIPAELAFHDWWCYLVISAFGKVLYDREPVVLHRKHANNTSLDLSLGFEGLKTRTQRILKAVPGKGPLTTRLTAFYALWGQHLPETQRKELDRFIRGARSRLPERIRVAFAHPYRRNLKIDHFFLTPAVLLGKY